MSDDPKDDKPVPHSESQRHHWIKDESLQSWLCQHCGVEMIRLSTPRDDMNFCRTHEGDVL